VPASAGGTQLAVTILRSDGVSFTFMPLDAPCVAAGESISAGQRIASLARAGVASSAETHLHVGAKRSDLYVDPMTLLAPPNPVVAAPVAEPTPAPAVPAERPAAASAPIPEPVEPPVTVTTGEPVPVTAATGVQVEVESGVQASPGAAAVNAVALAPRGASGQAALGAIAASARVGLGAPATGAPLLAPSALQAPVTKTAASVGPVALLQAQGSALPAVGALAAAPAASSAGNAVSAPGLRLPSASAVASAARQLGHAWLVALLGSLVAAGALWPLWRRQAQPSEEEPRCRISPEGTQVAAAAGR
jgi:hypothetical protein